jgi:site-specific DNA-methyltransferase (adenine-specific)
MQQTECISVFGGTRYYPQMIKRPADKVEVRVNREYKRTEIMGGTKSLGGETKVYDEWYPKTILTYSNANADANIHPTQKPVPLLEYLIRTYTLEGDMVLDSTMGVGSTGVACANTNRSFIGIEKLNNPDEPAGEKNPPYFSMAEARIAKAYERPQQIGMMGD